MGSLPRRLLCTWHVMKNWAIHYKSKISDTVRNKIHQDSARETNEIEFFRLKNNLFKYLEINNEYSFLNYIAANVLLSKC
jgi:hypothetical protein